MTLRTTHGGRGYGPDHEREHEAWWQRAIKIAEREGWGTLVSVEPGEHRAVMEGDVRPTIRTTIVYTFAGGHQAIWHLPD